MPCGAETNKPLNECNREWVLKKCANRNVLGSYYVPAEFLFW